MSEAELDALLRLILIGGASAPRRRLLQLHGSPNAARQAGANAWCQAGLRDEQIRAFAAEPFDHASFTHSVEWLTQPAHHLLGWHDPDYPVLLRRIPSPPLALFVAGDPLALWHPGVAVVGSRAPTAGGRDNAHDFAYALASSGLGVVSGLAAGIDTAAHVGALDANGLTVAVLGTGPDVCYPPSNTVLHAQIVARGAVVSEYVPGTQVRREHFPSRNRILAGLALGTLVIEAGERSGALITARHAGECGREVFAVPGSIHNPLARGCHRLIRDGAALVENAQECIASLAPIAAELGTALRARLELTDTSPSHSGSEAALANDGSGATAPANDAETHCVWQALGHDPTSVDRLVERTGLTAAVVSSMLLMMELDGRVEAKHGRYARKSPH